MNATWMRASAAAAGAITMALCLVSIVSAEPTSDDRYSGRQSTQGSLTRGDVDKILTQARSAIASGNLDQAEALVSKAETVQIRYPLFHMGPTPASVRRELNQAKQEERYSPKPMANPSAERLAAHSGKPMAAQPTDPFTERPMALPAGPASQPLPPSMPMEDAGMTPPVVPALHSHPIGERDNAVRPASADFGESLLNAPMPPGLTAAGDYGQPLPALLPSGEIATMPAPANGPALPAAPPKVQAAQLLREARQALAGGDLEIAEAKAREAAALGVPESAFLPHEDRPSVVGWEIQRARSSQPMATPAVGSRMSADERYAAQTHLNPAEDVTRNVPAATNPLPMEGPAGLRFAQLPEPIDLPSEAPSPFSDESLPAGNASQPGVQPFAKALQPAADMPAPPDNKAAQLLFDAETALQQHDRATAARLFGQAYVLRDLLNKQQQDTLKERLQMLASASASDIAQRPKPQSSLIEATADSEQALARQLSAEVGKKQSEARRLREKEPKESLKTLQDTRQKIANSELSESYKTQLLRRVDITIDETEKFIKDHGAEIEFDQKNAAVMAEVNRNKEVKIKVQQKVAELVDEFNRLRDEQRYAEMEVVARRLIEMAPDEPVAQQVWLNAKFIRRTIMNGDLQDRKEDSIWNQLNDVETSMIAKVGDNREMVFDQKYWGDFVIGRKAADRETRRTERELEIERRLKTPVMLRYEDTPLSEVMQGLSELAGVNIHLDPRGLSQEGVETSTPVTINLSKEISLKSALNLILEPLHLSYVVTDEVLKITSEQLRDGETYSKVYNVADLVIPIPNFVPNNNIGLQGLINDAQQSIASSRGGGFGMPGPTVMVNDLPSGAGTNANQKVLAQQFGAGGGAAGTSIPMGSGPGGMGGAASADFDSLIDLIVSTVASETWAENGGGEAEIRPFPTNLSLVISQTQAVHEEIADLLEQLRRLQDLQVTIEVRFIRLNDSFFERIGVDFQMNIEDRTAGTAGLVPGVPFEPTVNGRPTSTVVGLQFPVPPTNPFPNFTSDLDIPFRQEGFNLTRPVFGGTPAALPSFGFAILSEIEAYFLIEAAQGDNRTNVLNAPKVTLFNGQQAFVADAISRPFVIGVIPVVGEFAAAQQPVIVVLNEGTLMSIQAVVSNDRRYVRLTVVPFFTQVGNVDTFTFEGSSSSSSSSSSSDDEDGNEQASENDEREASSGVTVQLPSFQFVAVVTTVSVPDGGTVLLGGIKRLSEGRNEFGIPLLSKVPYVNRLFRNVGIGRTTDSLMMMVTPRIIIQEEQEEQLGITAIP